MAGEYNKSDDRDYEKKVGDYEEGSAAPVETQDRGLFDFLKKKEEKPQEEVLVTEFDEKVKVSEEAKPHHPYESYKGEKEEEKKHGSLLEKLHRSDSSSSSSSDEEEGEGEEKKKKKKDKKGLKDKIKETISGDHKEDTAVPVEKYNVDHHAVHHHEVPVAAVPVEKYNVDHHAVHHHEAPVAVEPTHHHEAPVAVEPTHHHEYPEEKKEEEKKGFLEKIKDKLPGGHKKAEEVPASPPSYDQHSHDHAAEPAAASYDAEEPKEKKGLLDKIKEKLPGYHPKTEEDKEIKEKDHKDSSSY